MSAPTPSGATVCTRQGCGHTYAAHRPRCTGKVVSPVTDANGNRVESLCKCVSFTTAN